MTQAKLDNEQGTCTSPRSRDMRMSPYSYSYENSYQKENWEQKVEKQRDGKIER
jgi:hypothetical protein